MAFIPSEDEIANMAATASWVAKVEGIPLEEAVLRVTKDWETRQQAERDQALELQAEQDKRVEQELRQPPEPAPDQALNAQERAEYSQMKKDRAVRARNTLVDGKKPLTASLGDLLRTKMNKS
jgi:hypothetical protein